MSGLTLNNRDLNGATSALPAELITEAEREGTIAVRLWLPLVNLKVVVIEAPGCLLGCASAHTIDAIDDKPKRPTVGIVANASAIMQLARSMSELPMLIGSNARKILRAVTVHEVAHLAVMIPGPKEFVAQRQFANRISANHHFASFQQAVINDQASIANGEAQNSCNESDWRTHPVEFYWALANILARCHSDYVDPIDHQLAFPRFGSFDGDAYVATARPYIEQQKHRPLPDVLQRVPALIQDLWSEDRRLTQERALRE